MLYTVMNPDSVMLCDYEIKQSRPTSSNPYDYIRAGYYLDNAALFGGENDAVNFNCNFKRLPSGYRLADADK